MDSTISNMIPSSLNLSSSVGVSVLGKSLESMKASGEGLNKILESSPPISIPGIGNNIDISL